MKKFVCIVITLICLFTSCSRRADNTIKVGVSVLMNSNRTNDLVKSISQEAATSGNIDLIFRINDFDVVQQATDIGYMLEKKIDILVVAPINDERIIEILKEVHSRGIKIILLEGGGDINFSDYDAKVTLDNYELGKVAAQYIESIFTNKGDVDGVIARGNVELFDEPRFSGFTEHFSNSKSSVHVSYITDADNSRKGAKLVMDEFLINRNKTDFVTDFVFAFNSYMAAGIKDSFVEGGFTRSPFIIGVIDFEDEENLNMIENSYIDAAVIYSSIGTEVVNVINKMINGESYPKEDTPSIFIVDKNNISLYRDQHSRLGDKNYIVETMATQIDSDQLYLMKQKSIIIVTSISVLLLLIFLYIFIRQNRSKQNLLNYSEQQNAQIKRQLEELTEQKIQLVELSNKLEESTQAKLVFFTNISHEFKTPLSLISSPITDLVNRKEFTPEVHELLDIIYRNSSRLNRLITELIDFRIYESDNISINYSIGNVRDFIGNISSLFSDVIKRRNVTFSFESSEDCDYMIPFDPIKLEKVFTNLMSNAFNHVKDNGQIKVDLRVDKKENSDRNLHLSVFNTDSYIPPELREKIFRRFYTMNNDKGTGIGLALTTAIIDALQGTISVESEENKGTKFSIDIPISNMLVTDAKFDSDYYEPDFAKLKVATIDTPDLKYDILSELSSSEKPIALVVEDNKDMRLYLRSILINEYRVLLAQNGIQGYNLSLKYNPAVIISDIFMPDKDGFELCLDLKANEKTKDTPIVLLTASSSDEQRAKGYECGADAYLQKPFNDHTLKIRLKKLLEKKNDVQEQINYGFLPNVSKSSLNDTSINFLNKFRKYVEDHIDQEISVDDIAEHFSYSKSKLYRELREICEYSPIDMVNLIRLRYAVDLMIKQNKNITETAFMCGFTSASYFSRVFQKYYNERPLSYVKRLTKTK